tara:strand:+ start:598 stop:915 length:318 start_codon:yes stop_codon:yes gene_type:complete
MFDFFMNAFMPILAVGALITVYMSVRNADSLFGGTVRKIGSISMKKNLVQTTVAVHTLQKTDEYGKHMIGVELRFSTFGAFQVRKLELTAEQAGQLGAYLLEGIE